MQTLTNAIPEELVTVVNAGSPHPLGDLVTVHAEGVEQGEWTTRSGQKLSGYRVVGWVRSSNAVPLEFLAMEPSLRLEVGGRSIPGRVSWQGYSHAYGLSADRVRVQLVFTPTSH